MNEEQLKETIGNLNYLVEIEPSAIANIKKLGSELSFEEVGKKHHPVKKLLKPIDEGLLISLPDQLFRQTHRDIGSLYSALNQIINFDPRTQDQQTHANFVKKYDQCYLAVVELMSKLFPLIQTSSQDTDAAKDKINDFLQEMSDMKEEMERMVEVARKSSGEIGVGKEAVYFKTIKDNHKASACWWLVTTVVLVASLAAYGVHLIESAPSLEELKKFTDVQWPFLIQTLFGKAILIGVLGYAIRLCSKNYLANRHNAVIAEHRQTSLSTYRAIVEAAGEQANRDIILLKAADSIFGQHITGFLKGNDGGNSSNSPVNLRMNPRLDTPSSESD